LLPGCFYRSQESDGSLPNTAVADAIGNAENVPSENRFTQQVIQTEQNTVLAKLIIALPEEGRVNPFALYRRIKFFRNWPIT